ncbi:MAG: IS30 family transposase, partial [Planctomycetota bacterium]|nr:IS30 family transposase [Planctomycetota bacterium]
GCTCRAGPRPWPTVVAARASSPGSWRARLWAAGCRRGCGSTGRRNRSRACLATHVERLSRYTVLAKLPDGTAEGFNAGTVAAFGRHRDLPRRTLTADNGKEFARFAVLETALGLDVYFARPYHAWQRGSAENTNGLLRQFFPKGQDLRRVTSAQVQRVESLLNHRPP